MLSLGNAVVLVEVVPADFLVSDIGPPVSDPPAIVDATVNVTEGD